MATCIPALRRYASALVRDHQEVDDLVHDCLVLALDRLNSFRDDGQLRAWLFAILHNQFVSQVRRAKVWGTAVPIEAADEAVLGKCVSQDDDVRVDGLMRALDRVSTCDTNNPPTIAMPSGRQPGTGRTLFLHIEGTGKAIRLDDIAAGVELLKHFSALWELLQKVA
jgi:hypothetical protein